LVSFGASGWHFWRRWGGLGDTFGVIWDVWVALLASLGGLGGTFGVIGAVLGRQGPGNPKRRPGDPKFGRSFGRVWGGFGHQNRPCWVLWATILADKVDPKKRCIFRWRFGSLLVSFWWIWRSIREGLGGLWASKSTLSGPMGHHFGRKGNLKNNTFFDRVLNRCRHHFGRLLLPFRLRRSIRCDSMRFDRFGARRV
jgi:hypothetical protein